MAKSQRQKKASARRVLEAGGCYLSCAREKNGLVTARCMRRGGRAGGRRGRSAGTHSGGGAGRPFVDDGGAGSERERESPEDRHHRKQFDHKVLFGGTCLCERIG